MYVGQKVIYEALNFQMVNWLSLKNIDAVFYGLFLIVIAEVFRLGAQLKEENDLTI